MLALVFCALAVTVGAMGITTAFLLGIVCISVVATVVFVCTRKNERRHQVGLAAAQEWAKAKADTYPSDEFGGQAGRVYRDALNGAGTSDPESTSDETRQCCLPPSAPLLGRLRRTCQARPADGSGEGQ